VRLASPIGSAAGGSVNLSTSLSNLTKLAAHSKFVQLEQLIKFYEKYDVIKND
jgi:hypothetical protein